ncbi:hypothetical protein XENTR_v10010660 [Xenopus tropicalis]|nr:hypothetical protein XENTR_v10010660 [Xenopus tropicalis]
MAWGLFTALLLCVSGTALSRPLELLQFLDSPSGGETIVRDQPEGLPIEDIIGSIEKMNKGRTRLLQHGDMAIPTGRSAIRCTSKDCYWPKSANGLVNVPYTLAAEYNVQDRATIAAAMLEFSTLTCIRFVPHTNERDFLNIISDKYKDSFNKTDTDNQGMEYDYGSVMHYGRNSYSIDYQLPTIQPIPNGLIPIGQRYGLSSLDAAKINRLYNCSICSSVLSGFSGIFSSSPSYYPNNQNCSWLIRIPLDKVLLQFSAFDVQSTRGCTADYIRVFDGPSRSSPLLLDRTCGSHQLPSLVGSGNVMLVEFVTDAAVSATGFKASYSTVSCGGTLTVPGGNFSSPGYTEHEPYPPFSDCTWTMIAPVGYKVRLNVLDVSVEYSSSCQYDSIEIRDGTVPTAQQLVKKCGTGNIPTVTSSQNSLLLRFYSDSSDESTGFLAKYSFVPAA